MNILRSPWLYLVAFMAFCVYSWYIVENGQNHVLREQNNDLKLQVKSLQESDAARNKLANTVRLELICTFTDPEVNNKINQTFADHYGISFDGATLPKDWQKAEKALIKQ